MFGSHIADFGGGMWTSTQESFSISNENERNSYLIAQRSKEEKERVYRETYLCVYLVCRSHSDSASGVVVGYLCVMATL
jgi:hypothetical protein